MPEYRSGQSCSRPWPPLGLSRRVGLLTTSSSFTMSWRRLDDVSGIQRPRHGVGLSEAGWRDRCARPLPERGCGRRRDEARLRSCSIDALVNRPEQISATGTTLSQLIDHALRLVSGHLRTLSRAEFPISRSRTDAPNRTRRAFRVRQEPPHSSGGASLGRSARAASTQTCAGQVFKDRSGPRNSAFFDRAGSLSQVANVTVDRLTHAQA